MKKLIILASFIIGAISVNAQTTPLVFKTSAGSATGTVTTSSTTMYVDVTSIGSSSITGQCVFAAVTGGGITNSNILPVVSNDGTNFTPIKSGLNYNATAYTTTWYKTGFDTVMRGATTDTALGSVVYKFPTGYKYVGFKIVGTTNVSVTLTAKGLAK